MTAIDIEESSGLTREFAIQNDSGIDDTVLRSDPQVRGLMRELSRWSDNVRSATGRGSMFDRAAFTPPANIYDEMRAARTALEVDDLVSGVADITEAFAFQGMKWESTESDEADAFNQWAGEINMDSLLRRMWREEYCTSQVVVATTWDWREYKVRGRVLADDVDPDKVETTDTPPTPEFDAETGEPVKKKKAKGRRRRKTFKLYVPTKINVLDSTKIVPVEFSPIVGEKLAWCASKAEMGHWAEVKAGNIVDLDMERFYVGQYKPSREEAERLAKMGVPVDRLLLLNPEYCFRHTLTKADYEAFATVRMKSIFGLLDLKRQLVNADRAMLIGAANYILLVKKGTDDRPGTPEEIDALKENYNFIAKLPVIISDHRLEIEIIAPKVDLTLNGDKYDTLDTRILMRLLGTLSLGSKGQRNETQSTLSHAVARMMENRRHMMKRTIESEIVHKIVEHPKNQTTNARGQTVKAIEKDPKLVFLPRHVTLGFDAALLQAMLSLRTQREISRETILEQFGLDQATEAMRMEHEEAVFDDVFKTQIPFAGGGLQPGQQPGQGDTGDPTANGRQGGRPVGGGSPSKDSTKVTEKTPSGTSKRSDS